MSSSISDPRLLPANTTLLQPGSRFFRISDALNYQVASLQAAGGALQTQIDNNAIAVAALQGEVSALQSQVTTLQSQVTFLQSQVATLQGEVATLQGQTASLQSQIDTINARLANANIP